MHKLVECHNMLSISYMLKNYVDNSCIVVNTHLSAPLITSLIEFS